MTFPKIRKETFGFLGLLCLLVFLFSQLRTNYSTTEDAQLKSFQVYALVKSGFQSEVLPYLGETVDPTFSFLPLENFILLDGKPIGVFPIVFAYLSAPIFYFFGFSGLPYVALIGLILILWQLRASWNFSNVFLILAVAASYLLPLTVDYSEYTIFLAILLFGTRELFKGNHLLAGIAIGLSVWFRHEGILFAFSAGISVWWMEGFPPFGKTNRRIDTNTFRFASGFLAVFSTFLLFNWLRYSMPLGPRFAANFGGDSILPSVSKFDLVTGLLFANWSTETLQIGFFVYMPFALLVLGYFAACFHSISKRRRILLSSTLGFLFLTTFLAPNTGGMNVGPRYLSPAIVPALLFARWFWIGVLRRKKRTTGKILYATLFTIPFVINYVGISVLAKGRKDNRRILEQFRDIGADAYIFHNHSVVFYFGKEYATHSVFYAPSESAVFELLKRFEKEGQKKKIAIIQFRKSPLTDYKLNVPRKDPLTGSVIKPQAWDEAGLTKELSKRIEKAEKLSDPFFDIWIGSISAK